jgi:hypothetical protein
MMSYKLGHCSMEDVANDFDKIIEISEHDSEINSQMNSLVGEAYFTKLKRINAIPRNMEKQLRGLEDWMRQEKKERAKVLGEQKVGLVQ